MIIDYETLSQLSLKELNTILKRLENELRFWENEKAITYETMSATDFSKERIIGGKIHDDMAQIDRAIDEIEPRIKNINKLIIDIKRMVFAKEEKMKENKKYAELIAYYRDEKLIEDLKTGRYRHLHWQEIASILKYSKDHCRKIYRNFKKR